MYIVLEWIVGAGKSTQMKLLLQALAVRYPDREVLHVREPWGTQIAEAIRTLVQGTDFSGETMHALTDAYLYAAARAQLLHTVVTPAREQGKIVIADRSFLSSMAYQGAVQGLGFDTIRSINQVAIQWCLPDRILFLDLPVDIGYHRTADAQWDKRERQPIEFFHKVADAYRALFAYATVQDMLVRIDADQSIEQVHEEIMRWV